MHRGCGCRPSSLRVSDAFRDSPSVSDPAVSPNASSGFVLGCGVAVAFWGAGSDRSFPGEIDALRELVETVIADAVKRSRNRRSAAFPWMLLRVRGDGLRPLRRLKLNATRNYHVADADDSLVFSAAVMENLFGESGSRQAAVTR